LEQFIAGSLGGSGIERGEIMSNSNKQGRSLQSRPTQAGHRSRLLWLAGVAPFVLASAAWGQAQSAAQPTNGKPTEVADADTTLKEITITAERRETSLQTTPVAVTAFDPAQLEEQGITDPRDLAGRVPSLFEPLRSTAYSTQLYDIRGIGEIDTYPQPAVGIYIDDVYLPRGVGTMTDIPNLSDIEVLRGPQGTLYGRNTSAGLLRFVTPDPNEEVIAWTQFGFGNYGDFENQSVLSGPIVDGKLYFSIAYDHRQRDGWTHDVTTGQDVNNIDLDIVRLKLRFTPTDKLDIVIAADGTEDGSSASYYTPVRQPNGVGGAPFNPNLTWAHDPAQNRQEDAGVSATITYKLDDELSLKSISSLRSFHGFYSYDNGGEFWDLGQSQSGFEDHDWTQEVQLQGNYGPLNFTTGLFYYHELFTNPRVNESVSGHNSDNIGAISAFDPRQQVDSYAIYGQAEYKITSALTATLGGRYTLDEQHFADAGLSEAGVQLVYPPPANLEPILATGIPATFSKFKSDRSDHWPNFSPKVGLQYQWDPDFMTYASFAEGYKSGGFDIRGATFVDATTPFLPETVKTYETGFKSELFDHTLRFNGDVYYNQINDLQLDAVDYTAAPPSIVRVNAGKAYTEGFEAETSWIPTKGLEWDNNVSYLWTDYTYFTATLPGNFVGATTLIGKRIPLAPRWNFDTAVTYELPFNAVGTWRTSADVEFHSKAYSDIFNTPEVDIPTQYFVNLSLGYTAPDDHWSATFAIKNLFDRQWNQQGGYNPNAGPGEGTWYYAVNPPRMITAKIRYTF